MADSFIAGAPDSTGKKVQTFNNLIGANSVHAQGIVLVTSAGAAYSGATETTLLLLRATANGKTITFVPVAQGAAGTTQLAAADASNKHKILGVILTMSAVGTLKFLDSSGDLTGPMDIAATGGFVLPASNFPYTQTGAVNRSISITTTGGKANGVVAILTEP